MSKRWPANARRWPFRRASNFETDFSHSSFTDSIRLPGFLPIFIGAHSLAQLPYNHIGWECVLFAVALSPYHVCTRDSKEASLNLCIECHTRAYSSTSITSLPSRVLAERRARSIASELVINGGTCRLSVAHIDEVAFGINITFLLLLLRERERERDNNGSLSIIYAFFRVLYTNYSEK